MGILPPDYGTNRYRYAKEWLHVVKRLWTEESVTFDGEWFHLKDCRSSPKPVQKPHPFIICAGTSDEGFRFTAQGRQLQLHRRDHGRAHEAAEPADEGTSPPKHGRRIKTATTLMPILDETDAGAKKQWKYYPGRSRQGSAGDLGELLQQR